VSPWRVFLPGVHLSQERVSPGSVFLLGEYFSQDRVNFSDPTRSELRSYEMGQTLPGRWERHSKMKIKLRVKITGRVKALIVYSNTLNQ